MSDRSKFDALLAEIGQLSKAMPQDGDGAIASAARAGEDDWDAPDETDASDEPEDDEDDGDDEDDDDDGEGGEDPGGCAPFGKSFTLRLEDGSQVSAVDGAALVKVLAERQAALESKAVQGLGALTALVKSLQANVARLGRAPNPRKSVINLVERPAATALRPDAGVSGEAFMVKALTAQREGRITGRQVAIAEQYLNAGQAPPDAIVRAVLA